MPRVDDRRVISGIVFVIRNGLRWRDAPKDYGPHKTIYNRFVRWSRRLVPRGPLAPRHRPLHPLEVQPSDAAWL